ncbi:MAG: hypothetical protein HZB16_15955 [Armatimonadetes bacterium]|nr:hypothetical protein [Armatimonadota bacterium]
MPLRHIAALWLLSPLVLPALGAELSVQWPLGDIGPRVTWDGWGEVVLVVRDGLLSSDLASVRRDGPGSAWLPEWYPGEGTKTLALEQRRGGRGVASLPLTMANSDGAVVVDWCTQRTDVDAAALRALSRGWASRQPGRADQPVRIMPTFDSLPPPAAALHSARLIVLDMPGLATRPGLRAALLDYAATGGTLALTPQADLAWPGASATPAPGPLGFSVERHGWGAVLRLAASPPLDPEFWQRLALARASSGGYRDAPSPGPVPAQLLARGLDTRRPIGPRPLAAYLLGYCAALLGLGYRARRRDRLAPWVLPAGIAVSFVGLATVLDAGRGAARDEAFQVTHAAVWSDQRQATTETTLRLFTGRGGSYAVRFDEARATGRSPARRHLVPPRLSADGVLDAWPWRIAPRSADTITGSGHADLGGTVSLRLRATSRGLVGQIANHSPRALRHAVLTWRQRPVQTYLVGDVAPGRTVPFVAAAQPAPRGLLDLLAEVEPGLARPLEEGAAPGEPAPPPPSPVSAKPAVPPPPTADLYAWVDAPWCRATITPAPARTTSRALLQVGAVIAPESGQPLRAELRRSDRRWVVVDGEAEPWRAQVYTLDPMFSAWRGAPRLTATLPDLRVWDPRRQAFTAVGDQRDLTAYAQDGAVTLAARGQLTPSKPPSKEPASYRVAKWPTLEAGLTAPRVATSCGRESHGRQ